MNKYNKNRNQTLIMLPSDCQNTVYPIVKEKTSPVIPAQAHIGLFLSHTRPPILTLQSASSVKKTTDIPWQHTSDKREANLRE